jgi:putative transposase
MGIMKIASAAAGVDVPPAVPAQVGAGEAVPQVSAQALAEALDPQLVARLAAQARAQGVSLLGRNGLLQQLTKRFLEASLEAEMDEHLGYGKHDAAGA